MAREAPRIIRLARGPLLRLVRRRLDLARGIGLLMAGRVVIEWLAIGRFFFNRGTNLVNRLYLRSLCWSLVFFAGLFVVLRKRLCRRRLGLSTLILTRMSILILFRSRILFVC